MTADLLLVIASVGAVLALGATTMTRVAPSRRPTPGHLRRSPSALRPAIPAFIRSRAATSDHDLAVAAWCSQLAREVRSGAALTSALQSVAVPDVAAPAIAPALLAVDRGAPLAVAMGIAPTGSAALDLATSVIVTTASFGGATAEPLDHVASVLRRRSADRAEASVHAAQSRMSAKVMSALPPAFLGLLVVTSPEARSSVATPSGLAVVSLGAVFNVTGWRWMRRIVRACR